MSKIIQSKLNDRVKILFVSSTERPLATLSVIVKFSMYLSTNWIITDGVVLVMEVVVLKIERVLVEVLVTEVELVL